MTNYHAEQGIVLKTIFFYLIDFLPFNYGVFDAKSFIF